MQLIPLTITILSQPILPLFQRELFRTLYSMDETVNSTIVAVSAYLVRSTSTFVLYSGSNTFYS